MSTQPTLALFRELGEEARRACVYSFCAYAEALEWAPLEALCSLSDLAHPWRELAASSSTPLPLCSIRLLSALLLADSPSRLHASASRPCLLPPLPSILTPTISSPHVFVFAPLPCPQQQRPRRGQRLPKMLSTTRPPPTLPSPARILTGSPSPFKVVARWHDCQEAEARAC